MTELDIVIVTYNSAEVIGDLLRSLPAALDGVGSHVTVVDNDSSDDTLKILEMTGGCKVVRSANVGYAAGINRGVREGTGAPAILILNPDVRLHPGSVKPLLATLQQQHTGICAPQVRALDGKVELSLRREPTLLRALGLAKTGVPWLSEYVTDPAAYERAQVVDWALGAILLMSRSCFDVVGGWDESYFLYSEETDLSLRARDLGLLTRYEPASVATHIGGASGRSSKTHAMQIVNRVRLYRRRSSALAAWCYYFLTVLSELSWLVRRHPQSGTAIVALLRPSKRPQELGCSRGWMPR
jgi:N-acetylglucosaminyl-diphospho-decaprenol L-rhamnosyltransferase